eukprot:32571_5
MVLCCTFGAQVMQCLNASNASKVDTVCKVRRLNAGKYKKQHGIDVLLMSVFVLSYVVLELQIKEGTILGGTSL